MEKIERSALSGPPPLSWLRTAGLLAIGCTLLTGCSEDEVTSPSDSTPSDSDQVVSSLRVWPCGCFSYRGEPERTIGVLGRQVRFKAQALNAGGDVLYESSKEPDRFSWTSSAPDVATVEVTLSPLGARLVLVTGVAEGTTTITATSEGASGDLPVTVRDRARLAWSTPLAGEFIDSDIAVGADGTIYVVTFGGGVSHLFAVSPSGAVLWSLDVPDSRPRPTPAIGADGTLYGRLGEDGLIAVSPGGSILWTLGERESMNSSSASPAIGADGTVYVAAGPYVYAVDPNGKRQWTYEAPDRVFVFSSPAVASDGALYVGGADGRLYAINADGSLRWTFSTGGGNIVYSAPAIGRDGTVYFGSLRGLYAVGPDGSGGQLLLDKRVARSPSIGADGTIYVGVGWDYGGVGVYAFDQGGSVRWKSTPAALATPILGADGTVYVTGIGGEPVIAALDSHGRLLWDFVPPGDAEITAQTPAIGIDGTILAVTGDPPVLYGIVENGGANGGYAGAPWPQAQGDRANTGRAGG